MSRPIDADALIEELKSDRFPGEPYVGVGLKIAIEKICEAPTIEPERKRGKWIPTTYRYVPLKDGSLNTKMIWIDATEPDDIEGMKCSECGTVFDFTEARNWCSECGADMRGSNP